MEYKHSSGEALGVHIKQILWKLIKADKLPTEEIYLICSTN